MAKNKWLTKFDIADMLSCTPSASIKLMQQWKVPFYYLGPGRGLGYRWKEDDVLAAINQHKICNTEPSKKKPKKQEKSIFDLPYREVRKKIKGY
jgi:hypothetical protein